MAVQWLGNVKQTGRGNLAKDIGDAVQPAVNAYSDYLSKTRDREKAQVDEFITRAKDLSVKEREAMMVEFQSKPKFMKQVEEYAPGVLGEGNTLNLPVNYEIVGIAGTQMILRDGDTTKTIDMGEGIDFDKYDIVTMADGSVVKENQRTGETTDVGEVKEIYNTSKNTITLDDGSVRAVHTIIYTDGSISETIKPAGINAELKGLGMSIEANKEAANLSREFQDKWKTKDLQHKVDVLEFSSAEAVRDQGNIDDRMEFTKKEAKRDQGNIETRAKTEKEKYDSALKEDARQFDIGTSLALYELSQTDEQFWAKMDHQVDMDMKRLNIDITYKNAIMQDMEDKMNLAHDKYDLSKTTVMLDYIATNMDLKQRQETLELKKKESKWAIKSIEATMNQYQSIGPVFAEDGKTIIGASGLRWDEKKGKYVEERLKNVPVSVARLMIEQQTLNLERNEQDNIIKSQGYSGLAAGVYGAVRNAKIPSMDSAEAWSSTAYMYAEKYAEGNEDVTAETAYGKILAHAYGMNWIHKDEIDSKDILFTDEATTAFNKEQEQWVKENPLSTKVEDITPSTNPNFMSGGLQTMTPEDNQIQGLLNAFLGNDTLYNNLKSAVTLPDEVSDMTLEQALSDMNFSGPISRLEDLAGGGAGRRLDEYTKGVERRPTGNSPTWKDVLSALGLEGGSE